MSGRIHRVDIIFYSRSPLSEPEQVFGVLSSFCFRCRGDSQGSRNYYSRSPLYEPESFEVLSVFDLVKCRGDYTGQFL